MKTRHVVSPGRPESSRQRSADRAEFVASGCESPRTNRRYESPAPGRRECPSVDRSRASDDRGLMSLWRYCAQIGEPDRRVQESVVCEGSGDRYRAPAAPAQSRPDCAPASDPSPESSWQHLLERLRPVIRHRLGRLLSRTERDRDPGIVDDREQDVYLRLLGKDRRAMRDCRARSARELLTFVNAICDSVVLDWHRGESALKRGRYLETRVYEDIVRQTFMTEFGTPEERLFLAELDRHCHHALESSCRETRHPERNRWMYERAVVDGWTIPEISRAVGLGAQGVDSTVRRLKVRVAERASAWRESDVRNSGTTFREGAGVALATPPRMGRPHV